VDRTLRKITDDVIQILGHHAQPMTEMEKNVKCGLYDRDGAFKYRGGYCQIYFPGPDEKTNNSNICIICRGVNRRMRFVGNVAKRLAQHCIDRYPKDT